VRGLPWRSRADLIAACPGSFICLECMNDTQKRQLEDDLRSAEEIHRSMQPRVSPLNGSWGIGIDYRPSRILSGDFYDLVLRDPAKNLALTIGDVVAHSCWPSQDQPSGDPAHTSPTVL
jgi:hypothetical protein